MFIVWIGRGLSPSWSARHLSFQISHIRIFARNLRRLPTSPVPSSSFWILVIHSILSTGWVATHVRPSSLTTLPLPSCNVAGHTPHLHFRYRKGISLWLQCLAKFARTRIELWPTCQKNAFTLGAALLLHNLVYQDDCDPPSVFSPPVAPSRPSSFSRLKISLGIGCPPLRQGSPLYPTPALV